MLISALFLFGLSFLVVAALGPSLWLAGSVICILSERWSTRRRRQKEPPHFLPTRISHSKSERSDTIYAFVGICMPILALLLGAWLYQRGGWVFAEQVLAASTVGCAILWLRLRRRGTPNAEVYAMAVWIFVCLGWSAMIAIDGPVSFGPRWSLGWTLTGSTVSHDYGIYSLFGGKMLTVISAAWALIVVLTALVLAGYRCPPVNPFLVISLALPYLCVFWFTEAMGWFHMTLAIAVIGYAISREFRRIEDTKIPPESIPSHSIEDQIRPGDLGAGNSKRRGLMLSSALVVTTLTIFGGSILSLSVSLGAVFQFSYIGLLLLATASLQIVILRRALPRHAVWKWVALHIVGSMAVVAWIYALTATPPEFVEVQVAATGGIALITLLALALRGKDTRYGAMLLGGVFMLIIVYIFDFQGIGVIGPPWNFVQFAVISVAAAVTLIVMWSVYGPGSSTESSADSDRPPETLDGIH